MSEIFNLHVPLPGHDLNPSRSDSLAGSHPLSLFGPVYTKWVSHNNIHEKVLICESFCFDSSGINILPSLLVARNSLL